MNNSTTNYFANSAKKRIELLRSNPIGFLSGTIFGGAYVGIGILLIFSVGDHLPASVQKLVMGLIFAIALILVVIAGAELFTGYAMYMALGIFSGSVSYKEASKAMLICWIGNLVGSLLVALLFSIGGANGMLADAHSLVYKIADIKMNSAPSALIARAILCNWLVCLAIWMAARVDSDVAKCVVIFWCLLAFIASGFEHSVANMTLLSLAVIGRAGELQTLSGAIYNLAVVTFGNLLSGAFLVGGMYWLYENRNKQAAVM